MSEGGFKFQPKKNGLAAALRAQPAGLIKKASALNERDKAGSNVEYIRPEDATDKIRIIFDDSGSMGGQAILDAHEGCIEFMRNCGINQTAVAIHPMNYNSTDLEQLSTNLPALSVLVRDIQATDSTPLFDTWKRAQLREPKATRYIIFSDGQPDDQNKKEACIEYCKQNKIVCDTIFIGPNNKNYSGYKLLKEIADRTGGYFLVFERGKTSFGKAFKYLAPALRLQLADGNFRKQVQDGTV